MASRQCMLAMELNDIEREKFDGLLAKCQICKLRYTVYYLELYISYKLAAVLYVTRINYCVQQILHTDTWNDGLYSIT